MNQDTELSNHPDYQDALEWFLRLQDAPDNPVLLGQLDRWLAEDTTREACYLDVMMMWEDLAQIPQLNAPVTHEPSHCEADLTPLAPASRGPRNFFAAAMFVCSMLFTAWLIPDYYWALRADYSTGTAEKKTVTLGDGTVVHLNARSAFSVSYSNQQRAIQLLYGEAYFNVASEPQRPFKVQAQATQTEALGTAFNIRIAENGSVQTLLTEGKVRVSALNAPDIQMTAGQKLDWQAGQGLQLREGIYRHSPAWLQNIMRLDEQPLKEVVRRMNRHYETIIQVIDPSIADIPISGTMPLNDLDTALLLLNQTLNINHTRLSGHWVLLHR